ncbi:hypothetical protein FOXB_05948 [Fusarium oxysporum f. sp. conglutinans Fo5176]|uniref:Uncharacterized protein n=1 Tax=Fusarium oxysporum (strain Fo5176) TaxID=660025 RepID=F9FHR9_FUSOF|nr:hypothetical protein FOXB_05948 [Fusarium oxysporum f. sp. conglutinans Fo5176]
MSIVSFVWLVLRVLIQLSFCLMIHTRYS